MYDIEQILRNCIVDPDVPYRSLKLEYVFRHQDRAECLNRFSRTMGGKHLALLGANGITHAEPDHESIELALRKDVSPFKFIRILSRQNNERRFEGISLSL